MSHALAQALHQYGIDALMPADAGLVHAPDSAYIGYGRQHRCVVVTSDQDFLRLTSRTIDHAGIAFCRNPEGQSIGDLALLLAVIHAAYSPDEMMGRVEYL